MNLAERIEQLEPRERTLLGLFATALVLGVLVGVPVACTSSLGGQRAQNARLREAIKSIQDSRSKIEEREAERRELSRRFDNPAPALAGFLERSGKDIKLEIPETQDSPPVPRGAAYEERTTKVSLSQVGMYDLARLMEKIEASGHAMSINTLNIRRRPGATDSWDVTLIVSAYDKKQPKKPAAPAKAGEKKP